MIGYQNDCHSFFLTLLSELHDENPANGTFSFFSSVIEFKLLLFHILN